MASTTAASKVLLRLILGILVLAVIILSYVYNRLSEAPAEIFEQRGLRHVLSIYGSGPAPEEQLKQPHDVAFDRRGNIYITDTGNRRVMVFTAGGRFLRQLGKAGTGPGEFVTPLGISVGADGRVYVADQTAGKVAIFDSSGRFKREFRVMMPLKPFVFDGRLYLADYAFVSVYDLSGRHLLGRWGGKGKGKGRFDLPTGLAVADRDHIYVADLNNKRIQVFDRRGKVRLVIGSSGAKKAGWHFSLPSGVAADERDHIYVVDAFNHELAVFKADGTRASRFSRQGEKEGELNYPAGIAYGGQGLVAVADKFNNRVQLLRLALP